MRWWILLLIMLGAVFVIGALAFVLWGEAMLRWGKKDSR